MNNKTANENIRNAITSVANELNFAANEANSTIIHRNLENYTDDKDNLSWQELRDVVKNIAEDKIKSKS